MRTYKLTRNIGLKIAALLFSIILWLVAINVNDPVETASFSGIPVEFINEEVVTNTGKSYELVGSSQLVRVTVTGTRSVLSRIRNTNISATADLSQMEANTYLVPITAEVNGIDSEVSAEVTPRNLQVKIEDVMRNTFPISVRTTGIQRSGYEPGEMTTNPETITIWGTESTIQNIHTVIARVDISGMSESKTVGAELVLLDGNENTMDQSQIRHNLGEKGLSVNVQMLNTKDIPISFNVTGQPAEGFLYTGYTNEPSRIRICGTKEDLDSVSGIEVPLDITGQSGRQEMTVDIAPYLPEGIRLANETANNVIVTVMIEQEGVKTIELPVESIQVKNLKENLSVSFEESMDLELQFTGTAEALEVLDVRYAASVDLKNYRSPGTYEVVVNIETPSGVNLTKNPTVRIILAEKDGG